MVNQIKTIHGVVLSGSEAETILDSALKQSHIFEYSCKNGQCGVCKTTLVEGTVHELFPQIALSREDHAKNKILTCCCAPVSDLLIDAEDLSALHGIDVKTLPCRIKSISYPVENITEIILRLPPTAQFNFLEGQYVDIIGPNSIRRSYSIASSSSAAEITLYIKRVTNGQLSQYWFGEAKQNDLLRLEGPKGTFYLRGNHHKLIFLATGTGIAPIIATLNKLEENALQGDDFGFDIELYWGNRYEHEFFWQPEYKNIKVKFTSVVSQPSSEWGGSIGYVQDVLLDKTTLSDDCEVYACGSQSMIESARMKLLDEGLAEACFFSDAFVSSTTN